MTRTTISTFCKLILITSIFALVLILPVAAYAQTVSLTPASTTLEQNQPFTVDIVVANMTDLFGIGFDLLFDPSLIRFIGAVDGNFLSQNANAPILTAVNPPGDLIFSQARMGAYSGTVSGSGLIARLNFQTLSQDGTSTLNFSQAAICKLVSGNCTYPPATWNNATVRISTPDTTAPSVPTGLHLVSATVDQINLAWNSSTDNIAVTGYKVYRDNVYMMTVIAPAYYNASLPAGTTYAYQVSAIDAAGNESARTLAVSATTLTPPDITAPSVPTGLIATAISPTEIRLDWNQATDNVGVTVYAIYRNGQLIHGNFGAANTTYIDQNLIPKSTYVYQVSAMDAAVNVSGLSAPVSITTFSLPDTTAPSVPLELNVVSVTANRVNLAWIASTDPLSDSEQTSGVAGYMVYRDNVYMMTVTESAYYNDNLPANTSYTYQVSAVDAAGNESDKSDSITVTTLRLPDATPPSVPTGLYLVSATTERINLAWDASVDPTSDSEQTSGVDGYKIYRNYIYMITVTAPAYYNAGLPAGTTYNYQVSAIDAANNESAKSAVLSASTLPIIQTDKTPPTAPTGLRASLANATTVNLNWSASEDYPSGGVAASGVAGYRIYRNNVWLTNVTSINYNDSGLAKSTTYVYQVVSYDNAGHDSVKSNSVQIATVGNDKTRPTTPGWLRKRGSTSYSIEMAWNASTDPSTYLSPASGVTGYKIYRNGSYVTSVDILSYEDDGLVPQTAYRYQVSAIDGAGNESGLSSILTASTDLPPDTVAPNTPANLRVNYNLFFYPRDVRLYWYGSRDNRSGQLKYNLYRNGILIKTTTAVSYFDKLTDYGVYQYLVKAVDVAGNESVGSNTVSINYAPDTTAPGVPANLRYSYNLFYRPTEVRIYWFGSRDERPGRVSYNIYRNDDFVASTSRTNYYEKLTDYGVYQYLVKAVDVAGNESVGSNIVSINYAPDTTAPGVPANFRVIQDYRDKSIVRAYWYGARDERPGRVSYNIYRNGDFVATATWTSFYEKLTDRGSYQYQVAAVDVAGNESAKSTAVTIDY